MVLWKRKHIYLIGVYKWIFVLLNFLVRRFLWRDTWILRSTALGQWGRVKSEHQNHWLFKIKSLDDRQPLPNNCSINQSSFWRVMGNSPAKKTKTEKYRNDFLVVLVTTFHNHISNEIISECISIGTPRIYITEGRSLRRYGHVRDGGRLMAKENSYLDLIQKRKKGNTQENMERKHNDNCK